jgi:DNA invertase Pin-like site-specific DNA recombinase
MDPAYGYIRTSSVTNIDADKDSERRQRVDIECFAKRTGYTIVNWFRDPAVSGADPVTALPGLVDMLKAIELDGVRTIIVEGPDCFACDLMVQMVAHDQLRALGVELIPASAPEFFVRNDPMARLVRQVLGALAVFEKAQLVAKLQAARERKRACTGKAEGRKNHEQLNPEMVAVVRELRGKRRRHGGYGKLRPMPLAAISEALAERGWVNVNGKPYSSASVRSMLLRRATPA